MSEVSIQNLKAKTSEILRKIEADKEPVTITRRGKAVARIVPLDESTPGQAASSEMEGFGSLLGQMTKMMESFGGATVEVTTTTTTPAGKTQTRKRKA